MPDLNDIHAIGIATCNKHLFDTCIQWLELAKTIADSRIKSLDKGLAREIGRHLKWAKNIHDQSLEKYGPISMNHRTNAVPFDKKLRKRKKYKTNQKAEIGNDKHLPLFVYDDDINLKVLAIS